EFRSRGWLIDIIDWLVRTNAAFVGAESTREWPDSSTAAGDRIHLMGRTAAPWIMAMDLRCVRGLGVGFGETTEGVDPQGVPYYYDVAGYIQKAALSAGHPVLMMPIDYRRKYRHFVGLSWRREGGLRVVRH